MVKDEFRSVKTGLWWAGIFILIMFLNTFRNMPREEANQLLTFLHWGYGICAIAGIMEYAYKWVKKPFLSKESFKFYKKNS